MANREGIFTRENLEKMKLARPTAGLVDAGTRTPEGRGRHVH